MMKAVDKLIFNTLISRKGVNIPQVGSLCIGVRQAKFVDGSKLSVPVARVEFSSKFVEGYADIVDLIAQQGELDAQQAQRCYAKWLEQASGVQGIDLSQADKRVAEQVTIEGVGCVKTNFFYPCADFSDILAPVGGQTTMRVKKRSRVMPIMLGIVAVLLLGAGVYVVGFSDFFKVEKTVTMRGTLVEDAQPEPVVVPAPKTQAVDLIEPEVKEVRQTARAHKYFVIAGVFSTKANAQRFIAESEGFDAQVLEVGEKRFLVSIFGSASETEAMAFRDKQQATHPGSWVYQQE